MPSLRLKPHPDVKAAVVADAKARNLSLNNVVREILATKYRVKKDMVTGRASNASWARNGGSSDSPQMPVPVSAELHGKIKREAERRERERRRERGATAQFSMNELVERDLCEHYGLPYVER
jgi:predicted HicB family RNase H-like nuclease